MPKAIFTLSQNLVSMIKKGSCLLVLFFCFVQFARAQDTLPKVSVILLGGKKALVSWVNPYENVTSINIQRSGDSIKNFKTIGSVFNVGTKENGFVDQKEFLPNEEYYRLFISFEGGDYLFTEAKRPAPDTSSIRPMANINLPGEEITGLSKKDGESGDAEKVEKKAGRSYFIPSKNVYYTNDGQNVVIDIPDAEQKKYTIKFFEDDNTFLFELKKIPEKFLILDKANFNHSGLFRFELYDNGVLKEKHKLYIPRQGRPVPVLDTDGYEISK